MLFKDKTGKEVNVGNWLLDTDGIFEVTDVDAGAGHLAFVREVFFEDANCDEYTLGPEFMLTRNEVKLMEIIS